MISLIQQYPVTAVLLSMMFGGMVGIFAAALCAAAGRADRCLECEVCERQST